MVVVIVERPAVGAFVGGTGNGSRRDYGWGVSPGAAAAPGNRPGNVVVISTAFRRRKYVVLWCGPFRLCMGTARIERSGIPADELATLGHCSGAWSSISLGYVCSLGWMASGALAWWIDRDCGSFACNLSKRVIIHSLIIRVNGPGCCVFLLMIGGNK